MTSIPILRRYRPDEDPIACPFCEYYNMDVLPVEDEPNRYFCQYCGTLFELKILGVTELRMIKNENKI